MRNDLDVYKVITLICILCVWMLHWLISKRTKGLIGEENRSVFTHLRLLCLFVQLILFDFVVVVIFVRKYMELKKQMNDIYLIAGIEVSLVYVSFNFAFSFVACCCELSMTTSNTKFS